jgi:glycerate 2-kinase
MPGDGTGIRADDAREETAQGVAHVGNRARLVDHGERELRATVLDLAEAALAALSPAAGLRRAVGQEAAIGAALALDGAHGIVGMFADTDGSDGGTAIAGGLVDWSTTERSRQKGMSLRKALVTHEATPILEACGDAMVTGPTQTNANDLVLILIR